MKTLIILSLLILITSCGKDYKSVKTYDADGEYGKYMNVCLAEKAIIDECLADLNDPVRENYSFNKYQCELEIFQELRDCGYYIYDENGQMVGTIY